MAIWAYADNGSYEGEPDRSYQFKLQTECSYCESPLVDLANTWPDSTPAPPRVVFKGINTSQGLLLGCPACGWWSASSLRGAAPFETHDGGFAEVRQVSGVLKNLDLADLAVPTEELRAYLLARYGDRFEVHPRKYEEIVGGVFSDFGFRVRVTSFSGDEGIDLFVLDGEGDATIGVQVKRYRGKIAAEQIRSFVGALVLQGLTTGIYVTSSSYEKGAHRTAVAAGRVGVGVTLLDARRFYDALRITTRSTHWDAEDESAPYYRCWQDIKAYLSDAPLPQRSSGRRWLDMAGYVWGSAW